MIGADSCMSGPDTQTHFVDIMKHLASLLSDGRIISKRWTSEYVYGWGYKGAVSGGPHEFYVTTKEPDGSAPRYRIAVREGSDEACVFRCDGDGRETPELTEGDRAYLREWARRFAAEEPKGWSKEK